MTSPVLSDILEAPCMNKHTNLKTLNSQPSKTLQNPGQGPTGRGKKSSKITGQKRMMPTTPDREPKRSKTMELNSTTNIRKVEAAMMKKCGVILDRLMKHEYGWVFNEPVDVVALRIPTYHGIVKYPMDLGTVKLKLGKCVYGTPLDFAKDVSLTFYNAMLFNPKGDDVHTMATVLLDKFYKLFDPAYEKYEVDCQRVIVGQRKFRRNMSDWERDQLGMALEELAGENGEYFLDEILQIVGKRNYKIIGPNGDGEIELDFDALDNETMWDLHQFVRLNSKPEQNDNDAAQGNPPKLLMANLW